MKFDKRLPILVAEDDPNDALLLERALRKSLVPGPVYICQTGEEVIEYVQGKGVFGDREQFPFPRILMLDLKMPKMNGLELLAWFRNHPECSILPRIVLTSSQQEQDISEAYKLGANAYWVKPSNFEDLTELLEVNYRFWSLCEVPRISSARCA